MQISQSEVTDLNSNGIFENTGAMEIYKNFRKEGVEHKEAVKQTIDGIRNLKSTSLSADQVDTVKQALHKIKGQWI